MKEKGLEMDLAGLLRILLKKSWIILAAGILSTAIVLTGTILLVPRKYQSSVMLYVNATQSTKDLADSFEVIIKMRESLMEVIAYIGMDYNHSELQKRITVTSVNDTDFFQITVSGTDPYETAMMANVIGRILPDQVSEIMEGTSVKVVGEAIQAQKPSSPNYLNNALLGFVIGVMAAVSVVILQELLREKEKIRSD